VRALVTGATGKVGYAVAQALAARGDEVVALVRDPAKARALLGEPLDLVAGDVGNPEAVASAARGCELVFNAMGIPEQWVPDQGVFERVNARGTETVVRAAVQAGARRVVHTSTGDVFHARRGGRYDESVVADYPKGTAYERSKQHAEQLALAARDGIELVIVNPSAVYGPGPAASISLGESLIVPVARGRLPLLPPGGTGVVSTASVAAGHLLAADRGRDGERYILSDRHVTLRELAATTVRVAHRGFVPPTLPVPVAKAAAAIGEQVARRLGAQPLLSRGQLEFFLWNAAPDSSKAQDELGFEPTLLEDGIAATLEEAAGL
jgi:dihydroflavonol-4-reductase